MSSAVATIHTDRPDRPATYREAPAGALTISSGQTQWSPEQLSALSAIGIDKAPDADQRMFLQQCQRTGLDPFVKQIYMIARREYDKEAEGYRTKWTPQTGIDGFRIIAERSGRYAGQTEPEWCGSDGAWRDVWPYEQPPVAARVGIYKHGFAAPLYAVAHFREYTANNRMWKTKGAVMISKCFDEETEVLTNAGFMPFADVTDEQIMQVTEGGLEPVDAHPFVQDYAGPMIGNHGDMLDFAVTPNHDMVTTVGKVEARAMLATTTTRGAWRIPMTAPGRADDDTTVSDEDLRLAGYIVADGWHNGYRLFNVSVSRQYKREALHALHPEAVRTVHSSGQVTASARPVTSNFDKELFTFPTERVGELIDDDKRILTGRFARLSQRQVRVFVDAWQHFDGHTNRKTGVRRLYSSNQEHVSALETIAVLAGYSINVPRKRTNDLADDPGYVVTLSEPSPQPVVKPWRDRPGIAEEDSNPTGRVWCVTVPSGQIVVRRRGFSHVVGNCAEALALRKAFPNDLSGLYTPDEMEQRDEPAPAAAEPAPRRVQSNRAERGEGGQVVDSTAQQGPAAPEPSQDWAEVVRLSTDATAEDWAALIESARQHLVDFKALAKAVGSERGHDESLKAWIAAAWTTEAKRERGETVGQQESDAEAEAAAQWAEHHALEHARDAEGDAGGDADTTAADDAGTDTAAGDSGDVWGA